MKDHNAAEKPRYLGRLILAILCFLGFSITLPPLGFILFLGFTGMVDTRSMDSFLERITPFQDALMPSAIIVFGILSVLMVTTKNPKIFRAVSILLVLLAVTSIGGCTMGLNGLKSIGS